MLQNRSTKVTNGAVFQNMKDECNSKWHQLDVLAVAL
jgi:hypothetical protein